MFSCPPSINKNKDLENSNSNFWRVRCHEQVIYVENEKESNKKLSHCLKQIVALQPIKIFYSEIVNGQRLKL